MAQANVNPLISSKPSDSNLRVSLHPLVLLTVSDQITRHRVRNQDGPIIGALLGQQNGRDITAEHAFPAKAIENTLGHWCLDQEWLERRLQQFKDVHKAPALDLVGWFTLCSEAGPTEELIPAQAQITTIYNESAILLTIHPSAIAAFSASRSSSGKLPISIYESVREGDHGKHEDQSSMQVDGEDYLKFRQLPYSIETDETEMIAIDYVAKGAGSATAVADTYQPGSSPNRPKGKPRQRISDTSSESTTLPGSSRLSAADSSTAVLSPEELDTIATITTRLNSVRMLSSRLHLLSTFIQSQAPSSLSDSSLPLTPESPDPATLPHLRSIQALLTRLSLLAPSDRSSTLGQVATSSLESSSLAQNNDVSLATLLSLLGQNAQGLADLGHKSATIHQATLSQKGHSGGNRRGQQHPEEYHEGHGSGHVRSGGIGGFGSMSGGMLV